MILDFFGVHITKYSLGDLTVLNFLCLRNHHTTYSASCNIFNRYTRFMALTEL